MNKAHMAVAMAAAAVIGVASAQQPPGPTDAERAKAERNAAAQKNMKSATEGTVKGYGGAAAEGSAKAAATKDLPRTAPDAAAKQAAVKSATKGAGTGYGASAADSAAVAAKDKSGKAPLPKPKAGTPEMQKVVP